MPFESSYVTGCQFVRILVDEENDAVRFCGGAVGTEKIKLEFESQKI